MNQQPEAPHLANARQFRLLQRRDAQINDLKKARDYRFKQQVKAEKQRDELLALLLIVRGKHDCGALTLPCADVERIDAAITKATKEQQ